MEKIERAQSLPLLENNKLLSLDTNTTLKKSQSTTTNNNKRKQKRTRNPTTGLRYFSVKVAKKLKELPITSYSEIADTLLNEYSATHTMEKHDHKNIRRRIYDALNVLSALNVIEKKSGKQVEYVGMEHLSFPVQTKLVELLEERDHIRQSTFNKRKKLEDTVLQYIALREVIHRNNMKIEEQFSTPPKKTKKRKINDNNNNNNTDLLALNNENNFVSTHMKLELPFVVVSTSSDTTIKLQISDDRKQAKINYNQPFAIHDERVILRELGKVFCKNEINAGSGRLPPVPNAVRNLLPFDSILIEHAIPRGGFDNNRQEWANIAAQLLFNKNEQDIKNN